MSNIHFLTWICRMVLHISVNISVTFSCHIFKFVGQEKIRWGWGDWDWDMDVKRGFGWEWEFNI